MDDLGKRLAYFLGASYGVGLLATQFWATVREGTPAELTDALSISHLVFGGLSMGIFIQVILCALSWGNARPVAKARRWLEVHWPVEKASRRKRSAYYWLRVAVNVLTYVVPYHVALTLLVAAYFWGQEGWGLFLYVFLSLALVYAVAYHLVERGVFGEEPDSTEPVARILGIAEGDRYPIFAAKAPAIAGLVIAVAFYGSVPQSLGGGRPLPVTLLPARGAPLDSLLLGTPEAELLRTSRQHLHLRVADTARLGGHRIAIVARSEVTVLALTPEGRGRFLPP